MDEKELESEWIEKFEVKYNEQGIIERGLKMPLTEKCFEWASKNSKKTDELTIMKEESLVTLDDVHKTYKKLLHIEDTNRIDIILAVALSMKLEGIPIWMILVGPSGDMKSVQLNSIRGKDVYVLHNFTSKTIVNGFKDKKKFPDLAPELHNKLVIIPDMAQILKLPPNEKGEVWGQLRDLYDGFAGKLSGQGSRARYENLKVTLLAGSTPAIDSQILVHQDLGTRELIYRTEGNKDKNRVMEKCFENEEFEKKINEELREITRKFLDICKTKRADVSANVLEEIKSMALYITYMRATAEFDNYTHELRNYVYPEEPTRIAKQLKRIYVCLKSLSKDYFDAKALKILWHIARSSAFPVRTSIFDLLLDSKEELSTSAIAEKLNVGKATIKRECGVFENMGIVDCRRQETTYPDRFYEFWRIDNKNPFVISYKELTKWEKPSKEIIQPYISIKKIKSKDDILGSNISLDGLPNKSEPLDTSLPLCAKCRVNQAIIMVGNEMFCEECIKHE